MADLSKSQTRVLQADRPTTRRSSIIPGRRDTEQVQRQAYLDIRGGVRGDVGGAEALMDFARKVNETGNSFVKRGQALDEKKRKEDIIQGAQDLEVDKIDPEKYKESQAYRTTVTRGQAKVAVSAWSKETKDELAALVNSFEGFEIEEQEAAIEEFMKQRKEMLLLDETGELRDFGSPEAALQTLEDLKGMTGEFVDAAVEDNRKNVKDRAINATSAGVMAALALGEPLDFEKHLSLLPDWVSKGEARDVIVEGTHLQAEQFALDGDFARAEQVLNELNESVRKVSEKEALPPLVSDGGGKAAALDADTGTPTGKPPVSGAVTSDFKAHQGRGSNGIDIDGKLGDAVELPAGGTVKKIGYNSRSGHFIIVDHGNGVETSYSHLSAKDVKEGDKVSPGQRIGAVGNSGRVRSRGGDGSHLHYVVRQNGKAVDPQSFRFTASAPQASSRPRTASNGTPLIDAFIAAEGGTVETPQESSQPRLVPILSGTVYSLTPQQRARTQAAIEQIRGKAERAADKAEQEKFETGATEVLGLFVEDNPPSKVQLREWVDQGRISPEFGWQMLKTIEAGEDRLEAKAERDEDEAEKSYAITTSIAIANEEIRLRGGTGPTSETEFMKYVEGKRRRGELGPAAQQASNIGALYSSWRSGRELATSNPSYKIYGSQIEALFAPKTGVAGIRGGAGDIATIAAAQDHYQNLVQRQGVPAAEAFRQTRDKYVKPQSSRIEQVQTDLKALEAKRGQ